MRLSTYRNLALAVAIVALPAIASASTRFVQSGNTSVNFDPNFLSTLSSLGVTPGIIKPAVLNGGTASFPIPTGVLDLATAYADISHAGGLSLTAGSTVVNLANFVIDTTGTTPVITGDVIQNGSFAGRVDLFNLALPALTLPIVPVNNVRVTISGIGVTLTADAAGALNTAFGVTAFSEGINIGTGVTNIVLATGNGR